MDRIGVVGCGLMGSGIAEITARAGANVFVVEQDADAMGKGRERVEKSLLRAVSSGKLPAVSAPTSFSRRTSRNSRTESSSSKPSPKTKRSSSTSFERSTPQ